MKKQYLKMKLFAIALLAVAALPFVSCSDDPAAENYYTTTEEMASSFLENRQDQFSKFIAIVRKSQMVNFDLLGTYGSYTVFAPTNEAVDIYLNSVGLSSVDELSVADCDTIAATHIIERAFFTSDFSNATLPTANMLDRYLTITCDSDLVTTPGQVNIAYFVNKTSRIEQRDDSVGNGVVHTMNRVINSSSEMLPDLMAKDSTITLFMEAFALTHMKDSMMLYMDESYSCSPDSTEEGHTFSTATEYDNVFYMAKRYYGYTAFVEQDEVYAEHGIYTIDDLIAYAKQVYDEAYPEDADVEDFTDRRNSLNRFVSYHFLDRRATYNQLTVDNVATNCFDRRHWDIADWYETMMPYSILKVSYPNGAGVVGRYVNRRGIQGRPDGRGQFVAGAKISAPNEVDIEIGRAHV